MDTYGTFGTPGKSGTRTSHYMGHGFVLRIGLWAFIQPVSTSGLQIDVFFTRLKWRLNSFTKYVSSKCAQGRTIIWWWFVNLRPFVFSHRLELFLQIFYIAFPTGMSCRKPKNARGIFFTLPKLGLHDTRSICVSNRQWGANLHHVGGYWKGN